MVWESISLLYQDAERMKKKKTIEEIKRRRRRWGIMVS